MTQGFELQRVHSKLHWNISMLFHHHGNDFKLLCNKFPGYKRAYASLRTFLPFSAFPSFPSRKGVTTGQIINHQLQRKHKETNSRKGTKGGRMRWVYSTYTTPPGDSLGRRWLKKAGMNYCIYILQKIKSWGHLKGNHRIYFKKIIPCDLTWKWLLQIKLTG